MLSFSIQAQEKFKTTCPLSKKEMFKLIESSPYWVDNIECINDEYYQWNISNKRAIYPHFQKGHKITKHKSSKVRKPKRQIASAIKRRPAQISSVQPNRKKEIALDKNETGIFDFGVGLGGKYYSHGQSGVLGSANVGALFLNNISLFTSYAKRNFKLETRANTYKFSYDVNGSISEKQLYSYSIRSYYKNLFFGLSFEQQPLFKNSSGNIEMVTESFILPSLGYNWNIQLSTKIDTQLSVQASASYYMESSASDPDIKISGYKGFGADIQTRLTRKINNSKRFPLYYYWSNEVGYRDYKRSVNWGNSSGTVNSSHLNLNSTIGLKIEF